MITHQAQNVIYHIIHHHYQQIHHHQRLHRRKNERKIINAIYYYLKILRYDAIYITVKNKYLSFISSPFYQITLYFLSFVYHSTSNLWQFILFSMILITNINITSTYNLIPTKHLKFNHKISNHLYMTHMTYRYITICLSCR